MKYKYLSKSKLMSSIVMKKSMAKARFIDKRFYEEKKKTRLVPTLF